MVISDIRVPWRVKNWISSHFPLVYHLAVNVGRESNSGTYWDQELADSWSDETRHWPTKNRLIASLTDPTDVILDVGCGTGSVLRYLQVQGYENLHGLECSLYAVQRLGALGIKMHHARLPDLPLPDETYDVVIASQILEHIIRRGSFVKAIHRILKPGGRLLVFVPDNCLGPISEPTHVTIFNERKLYRFLCRYFETVDVQNFKDENFEMPILFACAVKTATPNAPAD